MFKGFRPVFRRGPRLLYSIYRRYKSKVLSWVITGRKCAASVDPFQLYWIDPNNIKYIQDDSDKVNGYPYYVSEVRAGSWDKRVTPIDEHDFFESFEQHFVHDVEWEETPWVNRTMRDISERGLTPYNCRSVEEFEARLDNIDQLYRTMCEQGYRTQRDLMTDTDDSLGHDWARFCPELHEITVNIGRDGRFIFEDGWHRLAISRILNIERIPVRVNIRHLKWQQLRDEFPKTKVSDQIQYHPDIY